MFDLLSGLRPTDGDLLKAAGALFARGAGFTLYPGPAAILRQDGTPLEANQAARRIATSLGMGTRKTLHPVLAGAIRAGQFAAASITIDAAPDTKQSGGTTYEFAIMPLTPGETALVIGRDTALESAFRGAITESRQRYKELVEICGDFCWETGADGRFAFVSPGGALDYPAEALVGHHPAEFLDSLTHDAGETPFSARIEVVSVDVWFRRADGRLACLETSSRPIGDGSAGARGNRGVCRDVTADRDRAEELSRVQIRERLIAHTMRIIRDEVEPDRMLLTAAQAVALAIGAQGCRICREDRDGALITGANFGNASVAEEIIAGALARLKSDGRPFSTQHGATGLLCAATSYRQSGNGAIVLWRDVKDGGWTADECALVADVAVQLGVALQQLRYQSELETLSRTDGLTGLLNRRAFTAELEARLARRDTSAGALFYVDLDNFKPVNDILGHQKGDEALKAVSEMLQRNTRPGDLVARLGGDEFALWLDRTDDDAARTRAADLLDGARCLMPYSGDPAPAREFPPVHRKALSA